MRMLAWMLAPPLVALGITGCAEDGDGNPGGSVLDGGGAGSTTGGAGGVYVPPTCALGLEQCGSECVDLESSPTNCGTCGTICDPGQVCSTGVCSTRCATGETNCSGACVDPNTNAEHCGACGVACLPGQACVGKTCQCRDGLRECGGACTDVSRDVNHCGACGHTCLANETCALGRCQGPTGSGGTGGGGPTPTASFTVDDGGFVSVCAWAGYAWTSADASSSIHPEGFEGSPAGTDLCVNGTVAASWSGSASLGINIGQAPGENTVAANIDPGGEGIYVDISNPGSTPLRIQIQDSTDGRWCVAYEGPGFIPWSAFRTQCRTATSGTPYAGDPISLVAVVVAGTTQHATDFDFCVSSIACDDGETGTGGAGSGGAPTGGGPSGGAPTGGGGTGGVATGGAGTGGALGGGGSDETVFGHRRFVGNITTHDAVDSGNRTFSTYWDQISPENAGKWGSVQRSAGSFNWATLDAIRDYAVRKNIIFKEHTFIWGNQQPGFSIGEQQVKTWMQTFCDRYPEAILIDVVNEPPPHTTPAYANSIGGGTNGSWTWIANAFKWAREACPNAVLILNDYNNIEWQGDSDHFIGIVKAIKAANAPIDAIGCQAHDMDLVDFGTVKRLLTKLHSETQLPVYITEYDPSTSDDNRQLAWYKEQIPYFWEQEYIQGITIWGWIYGSTWSMAPESGLIRNGNPRPAMTWLMDFLGRPAP